MRNDMAGFLVHFSLPFSRGLDSLTLQHALHAAKRLLHNWRRWSPGTPGGTAVILG
jgi:hypothetical protein